MDVENNESSTLEKPEWVSPRTFDVTLQMQVPAASMTAPVTMWTLKISQCLTGFVIFPKAFSQNINIVLRGTKLCVKGVFQG